MLRVSYQSHWSQLSKSPSGFHFRVYHPKYTDHPTYITNGSNNSQFIFHFSLFEQRWIASFQILTDTNTPTNQLKNYIIVSILEAFRVLLPNHFAFSTNYYPEVYLYYYLVFLKKNLFPWMGKTTICFIYKLILFRKYKTYYSLTLYLLSMDSIPGLRSS